MGGACALISSAYKAMKWLSAQRTCMIGTFCFLKLTPAMYAEEPCLCNSIQQMRTAHISSSLTQHEYAFWQTISIVT